MLDIIHEALKNGTKFMHVNTVNSVVTTIYLLPVGLGSFQGPYNHVDVEVDHHHLKDNRHGGSTWELVIDEITESRVLPREGWEKFSS